MPANDDFDDFEDYEDEDVEVLEPDYDEYEGEEDEGEGEGDEYEEEDVDTEIAEPVVVRRRPAKKAPTREASTKKAAKKAAPRRRSAATIPATAPKPQDRKAPARKAAPKRGPIPAQVEADSDDERTVTILGDEYTFLLSEMQNSWDVQEGFTDGVPIKIIRGVLGAEQYLRLRSRAITSGAVVGDVLLEGAQAIGAALGMPELGK
ncbi:hypothetical protein [Rhodococcus globerulus]|uniref:Tail assembly chaperone n=1 Tax=Rhodococcus globerulus TaxID=33008 RepID=A0ABU4BSA9_RHOGO|nr:hypothetical protein [Rhodococcus globerulus]MDV6267079.1 hypothetical protein [Rhodococcus globerulus]